MNLANYIFPLPSPYQLEDNDVFDEEFVVDNLGCTSKMKTIVEGKRSLSYCLSKRTDKKEVYIIHFHGRWEELKWTFKTICDAGLTFYRNVDFYSKNKTRFLAMDFDGKKDEKHGLYSRPAECIIGENNFPGVLVIPSSRCNYVPGSLDENAIKKYHVFAYTKPYDCTEPRNIADLSDRFSMDIDQCDIELARKYFPWDKKAMSSWLRFFSKSAMQLDQIEKVPTINIRYSNGKDAIFEYRNFTQMFNKDFLTVNKCEDYVPNKEKISCKNIVPYTVPPFDGFQDVNENKPKKRKREKNTDFRDFWQELKVFAGINKPGVYPLPHYGVGRIGIVNKGDRNNMATKIMWGIAFNIYAAERYCKKKMEGKKAFALEWFGSIFNANNVEDYKGFIKEFNAPAEYSRKSDDIQSMESHYDCPENIEESKFYRTVKVGFGGSYAIKNCKTRDELERVASEIGMSKRTTYRKAKEFGLPRKERKPHNPHKSKLDKYVALSKDELDELVKKGILNRMDKCRIIKKRNKSLIGYIQ